LENLTHSLVGAVVAEAALGQGASPRTRRVFLAAGIIASNAPDLDLLYTAITPMPIGYLLHHRGHTHTLVGLLALFGILTPIMIAVRSLSQRDPPPLMRLCVVLALGLGSHLALDAGNNYGVHPFFPIDNRWSYGDTIFIFEPWLWLMLGAVLLANATTPVGRALLGAGLVVLPVSTVVVGLVPWESLAILAALTSVLAWGLRERSPASRAVFALIFCALFTAGMFLVSRHARAEARAELALPPPARVLDIVMTPSPAFPVCWAAIVLERDDQAGTLVLRRGSLSLMPGWWKADACPLNRFATSRREAGDARFAPVDEYHVPLERLRALTADCRSAAWLRFARAPVVENGRVFDLRFETAARGNFTTMSLMAGDGQAECPGFVPDWAMPRADAIPGR
jgi:inner membrane protein